MLNEKNLKETSNAKQSSLVQYQQNNRNKTELKVYLQNFNNVCKTSENSYFVNFAMKNSLILIEKDKGKAKKAVSLIGRFFFFFSK